MNQTDFLNYSSSARTTQRRQCSEIIANLCLIRDDLIEFFCQAFYEHVQSTRNSSEPNPKARNLSGFESTVLEPLK